MVHGGRSLWILDRHCMPLHTLGVVGSLCPRKVPSILVDHYFYRSFVFAALNILKYNVTASGGAQLYGVEPYTYYIKNLLINFNLIFVMAVGYAVRTHHLR